jgi:thioredoxin 1
MKGNFQELVNAETPVLVDFSAEWCGPCKAMAPILQDLAGRVGDKARIVKIDVDKNPELASHFKISGVPTLMLFQKGETKWRQSGVVSAAALEEIINKHTN